MAGSDARLLVFLALAAAPAAWAQDASLPCSVRADGELLDAHYQGAPRRNPDGSFYPGDAFYYIVRFSASSTCIGLSAGPVLSHEGLDMDEHRVITWQDAGPWPPGLPGARAVETGEAKEHAHLVVSRSPRLLETVHYYWGDVLAFSSREDSKLHEWQERFLAGKDYRTESTWGWDYAEAAEAHAHLPPCGPDEGPCAAPDPLEDPASRGRFMEAVAEACSPVELYSGCAFGKARVNSAPVRERCLISELEEMGVRDPPERDRCVGGEQIISVTVTGIKKSCVAERGATVCRAVPVPRTVALASEVLAPDLGLSVRHERAVDSDGYLARNADGTYYVGDPVVLAHEPVLEWKDSRHRTVRFEVWAESALPLESRHWCEGPCTARLERELTEAASWDMGHGGGLSVYSAPGRAHLGPASFEYVVRAYNGGVHLGTASASEGALIAPYDPVYAAYAYPAISDGGRTSYEDRVGLALHYFGSRDGGELHEGRRSKVDGFSYSGSARGPWEEAPLGAVLSWSGARGAGYEAEHAEASARLHPGAVQWRAGAACDDGGRHGTLMMVRAGYCRAYFSYPVHGEVSGPAGPRLEGVELRGELYSGLAAKRTALLEYWYRFAEPLFHSGLHVRAFGADGKEAPARLRVDVEPAGPPLREYVRQKVLHDTGDAGLAAIAAGDAGEASYSESGSGSVSAQLRRVASEFPAYGGSADAGGMGVRELAGAYVSSSDSARLAVPLDVGLGAPSPVRVTVTADGEAREYLYRPDFSRDVVIVVNAARDNPARAERGDGYVEASVPPWFGPATAWYVDGRPSGAGCAQRCTLQADGRGPVLVEAENAWGGRASAEAAGLGPEPPGPRPSANVGALAALALALPAAWWVRRRIAGRPPA